MKPTILLLILFLTSCHTFKWAEKGIDKRDNKFPEIVASICSSRYNPIDSVREVTKYLPGKIVYKYDSILVNCDSLKRLNPNKPLTIKIPCPPSILKTDTIFKDREVITSNKGEIYLLNKTKDSLKNNLTVVQKKLTKRNKQLRNLSMIFTILLLGIGGIVYIKLTK